ncbi:MAG: LTA synthase family protein [Bacteroidales bacterium]|nr:LTA synthase family protein [Bacteroidales bacterium]
MKKYIESTKSFCTLSICFIILLFCVKSFEMFTAESLEGICFDDMITSNLIASLFICFCVFIVYNVISFFSKKVALYVSSIFFSVILITEFGLAFYYRTTGLLMGSELIERPLWETIHTIKSVVNFWMTAAALVFIAVFTLTTVSISERQKSKKRELQPIELLILMLFSVPLFFIVEPNHDANAVNKLWYCVDSCIAKDSDDIVNQMKVKFDKKIVEKYKTTFPDRDIIVDEYPLERHDNIDNVLGPYFETSEVKPDIVFVIIESLGSDFFGQNKSGYTLTPFLDSLSRHSLLWTNCLSSTPRSAGVLPAMTASVPYGLNGFQFGDMPNHNSMFSILKDNSYKTNVFYGGSFAFDRVYDYLVAQEIDYMSPFASECSQNKKDNTFDYTSWGYHDAKLYERSLDIINNRTYDNPNFDVFVTLSQHDNSLKLNTNKELQDYYYVKAEEILSSIPSELRNNLPSKKGFMAAFLYGDDAFKNFFKKYNESRNNDNVIFVITGDHSLNLVYSNPLNAYHVPLIIWSPLLKKSQHFHSVVSHNDITPSLTTLLRDNFGVITPENVHWVTDGLDTTASFVSNLKTYFITPSNMTKNCLYNDIFYIEINGKDNLYRVEKNLHLKKINDSVLLNVMKGRMNMMLYIDNYTYINNKLTKNPILQPKDYKLLKSVTIDSAFCQSGSEKPSDYKCPIVNIYSQHISSEYSEIKVNMTAKIKYTANITHEKFIRLNMKSSNAVWATEPISKSIIEKNYHPEQWYNVDVTKIFKSKNNKKPSFIEIYMIPSEHDHQWDPNHSVTLKDININILGVKK